METYLDTCLAPLQILIQHLCASSPARSDMRSRLAQVCYVKLYNLYWAGVVEPVRFICARWSFIVLFTDRSLKSVRMLLEIADDLADIFAA